MLRRLLCLAALAALVASGCAPSLAVSDPACRGAYDSCVESCEGLPPPLPYAPELESFAQDCAFRCQRTAQSCQRRVQEAERARKLARQAEEAERAEEAEED